MMPAVVILLNVPSATADTFTVGILLNNELNVEECDATKAQLMIYWPANKK
ncbi:MAG: hypothetical protein ABUT20_15905 [Bacteroidota bacterium]